MTRSSQRLSGWGGRRRNRVYRPYGPDAWAGPASGLTHRWQMDDGTISGGNTVLDLVGTLNATYVGTPGSGSSPTGAVAATARTFDGATNALSLSGEMFPHNGPFSWGCWLNVTDVHYTPDGAGTNMRLFNSTNNADGWGALVISSANETSFNFQDTASAGVFVPEAPWGQGVWMHMAVTNDGAGNFVVYGNAIPWTAIQGATVGVPASLTASMIAQSGNSNRKFKGSLYQLCTYNRALTAAEVRQLYGADGGDWVPATFLGANSGSGKTITTTGAAAAASLIVVTIADWDAPNDTTVRTAGTLTDSAGNVYTRAVSDETGWSSHIFYCLRAAALPAGGTITLSGAVAAANYGMRAVAVPGYNGGIDKIKTSDGTASSYSMDPGTLAQPVELCIETSNEAVGFFSTATNYSYMPEAYLRMKITKNTTDGVFSLIGENSTAYTAVMATFKSGA